MSSLVVSIFIFLVSLWITFFLFRNTFFLFPLLHMVENTSRRPFQEIYFENEMGAWLYPPQEQTLNENILVYFNGNAGNVSTRVTLLRAVQDIFPTFSIYHLEYPGFGISEHLQCDFHTIVRYCTETCELIRKRHDSIDVFVFWGESLGALVQAHVYRRLQSTVDWIFQVNGVNSLADVVSEYCPSFLHGCVLPCLPTKENVSDIYTSMFPMTQTRLGIFHATQDDIVPVGQSYHLFLTLKHRFPERVFFTEFVGRHNRVLSCEENKERIQTFVTQHMMT